MALDTTPTKGDVLFAPQQGHHRQVKAVDAATPTKASAGANAARFRFAHVAVVPSAGANVSVGVYFWNEFAQKFIPGNPAITRTKTGAGNAYEFTFEVGGRIFWVGVEADSTFTTPGTDGADIYVQGYHHESVAM